MGCLDVVTSGSLNTLHRPFPSIRSGRFAALPHTLHAPSCLSADSAYLHGFLPLYPPFRPVSTRGLLLTLPFPGFPGTIASSDFCRFSFAFPSSLYGDCRFRSIPADLPGETVCVYTFGFLQAVLDVTFERRLVHPEAPCGTVPVRAVRILREAVSLLHPAPSRRAFARHFG